MWLLTGVCASQRSPSAEDSKIETVLSSDFPLIRWMSFGTHIWSHMSAFAKGPAIKESSVCNVEVCHRRPIFNRSSVAPLQLLQASSVLSSKMAPQSHTHKKKQADVQESFSFHRSKHMSSRIFLEKGILQNLSHEFLDANLSSPHYLITDKNVDANYGSEVLESLKSCGYRVSSLYCMSDDSVLIHRLFSVLDRLRRLLSLPEKRPRPFCTMPHYWKKSWHLELTNTPPFSPSVSQAG